MKLMTKKVVKTYMIGYANSLIRVISKRGPAETVGNLVFNKNTRMIWQSQRQAAKTMNVSANVLSKYLSGKLPKLYR
jgi:hypothetical protein